MVTLGMACPVLQATLTLLRSPPDSFNYNEKNVNVLFVSGHLRHPRLAPEPDQLQHIRSLIELVYEVDSPRRPGPLPEGPGCHTW